MRDEDVRRFELRLVELRQRIHVIPAVNVVRQHLVVIHDLHDLVPLFALRDALGEAGHNLLRGTVQDEIFGERLAEWHGLRLAEAVLHRHGGDRIKARQRNDLLDELRRVARDH